jgi:arylformamidase
VAWVIGEGARHGASAHRLVVGGHSAGGHVAAMLMARDWRDDGFPMNPLHGGVSLSGVHDLRPLTRFSYNVDLKLDDDEAASSRRSCSGRRRTPRWSSRSARTRRASSCASPTSCGTPGPPTVLRDGRAAGRSGKHHFDVVLEHADPASRLTRSTLALFPS